MSAIKTVLVSGITLVILDAIYLNMFKEMFGLQIAQVQRVAMQFKLVGAIFTYILLISGLYYFILKSHRPVQDAFILGVVIYGVYEFTNYSIFKQWKWSMVAIDTLWGGIAFALTTYITYKLLRVI